MVKEVNLRDTLGCTDSCQLIIDDKEVVLLKQGDDALINKSIDRLNRNLYTFNDKVYLHFRGSFGFCDFREYHFFNDNDRDLNLVEDLQSDYNRGEECIGYFTRSEIEKKV